jgi:type 1 glutamine amidotransferase
MVRLRDLGSAIVALAACLAPVHAEQGAGADEVTKRVYGEWRIHVKPDQGPAYDRLIEQSGLPLFRAAGGRMVGWWKTLVGDLYEHLTIWEYDDMAAFERAIGILSKDPAFARFVAARDPLLAGEENRFLRLLAVSERPRMPETAAIVIHAVHRVPLAQREAYLAYVTGDGLRTLRAQGVRVAGPFVAEVGRWSEVSYLFPFEGLAECERRQAEFAASKEGRAYKEKLREFASEVTTRLLVPASFAKADPAPARAAGAAERLPHREEVAPGVFAAGFSDRQESANCGWIALAKECLLVDLPRGIPIDEFLELVIATTGKPARSLVLTHLRQGDVPIVRSLLERGVTSVLTSRTARAALVALGSGIDASRVEDPRGWSEVAEGVEFASLDDWCTLYHSATGVVFTGPFVIHGPRAVLPGHNTAQWLAVLRALETKDFVRVVPAAGSWGGPELLARQRRFLAELRRQVGYHVAQGRPLTTLRDAVRMPASELVWMPYDTPTDEDLESVYRELTVPMAPFGGEVPVARDSSPHALVLIGDQPHEPGHIEDGLRPVFNATGIVPHVTVDVRALSAETLAKVQLLVILRDGLQRPSNDSSAHYAWMTPEQERAVVAFVEGGGGFLNLHNAMGLYPKDGPYLNLVGGRYIGHGPLERFRVEVVDADHPITRGVHDFFVADEQHTPPRDEGRTHLLLRNRSDDGKAVAAAGWVREAGRGRVCHLANGHTREALCHPMFQTLLRNAMRWCVRIEDRND